MEAHPDRIKYVSFCSNTTSTYEHMIRSKYGLKITRTWEFGVPLMPLIFFYDKPHVCSTAYYREVVLGSGSLVQQGCFIEETLGKAQRTDILEHGMSQHSKYGTYQLDERDDEGRPIVAVRHVNGRSFLSPTQ